MCVQCLQKFFLFCKMRVNYCDLHQLLVKCRKKVFAFKLSSARDRPTPDVAWRMLCWVQENRKLAYQDVISPPHPTPPHPRRSMTYVCWARENRKLAYQDIITPPHRTPSQGLDWFLKNAYFTTANYEPWSNYNRLQPTTTDYNRLQPTTTDYNRLQPTTTSILPTSFEI